jgi:hypothetical protein
MTDLNYEFVRADLGIQSIILKSWPKGVLAGFASCFGNGVTERGYTVSECQTLYSQLLNKHGPTDKNVKCIDTALKMLGISTRALD